MKFFSFCLSWSLAHKAACVPFCIQHFFLPFFFLHFQKDLFLRTDEPHTEKTNRPDCLVLSTHRWGQIFRRAQFPRRYLNKWQILKRGNMPTFFGAQLVLELLWKTRSAMAVLLCLRYKNSKSPSFVPMSLCHTYPHAILHPTGFSWPSPACCCVLLLSLRGQHVHTRFLQGAHQG